METFTAFVGPLSAVCLLAYLATVLKSETVKHRCLWGMAIVGAAMLLSGCLGIIADPNQLSDSFLSVSSLTAGGGFTTLALLVSFVIDQNGRTRKPATSPHAKQ